MSRELKFRVWDKKLNKFTRGYDEEVGSFDEVYSDPPGIFFAGLRYLNEDSNRYIIQQYTGLKDSKGKEIYEGDIVKELRFDDWGDTVGYEYRGVVYYKTLDNYDFNNGLKFSGVVTFPNLEENQKYIGNSLQTNCEIIGNIFEHKHLLEK